MPRYSSRRNSRYGRSQAPNQALKHIEAAQRFSAEMGGLDGDVKDYFFALSEADLRRVLDAYEQSHGIKARTYAEKTIPKWQTERVTMSGMVAERLFGLLPRFMPLQRKYALIEGMWRHIGPSSKKMLRVGSDASLDNVLVQVREHITTVVASYSLPAAMERRFTWLSQGDVQVKQQLLNYFREQEKQFVTEGARSQLGLLLSQIKNDVQKQVTRLNHTLQVGKHELHVVFERGGTTVSLEEFRHLPSAPQKSNVLVWIVGALVVAAIIAFLKRLP